MLHNRQGYNAFGVFFVRRRKRFAGFLKNVYSITLNRTYILDIFPIYSRYILHIASIIPSPIPLSNVSSFRAMKMSVTCAPYFGSKPFRMRNEQLVARNYTKTNPGLGNFSYSQRYIGYRPDRYVQTL